MLCAKMHRWAHEYAAFARVWFHERLATVWLSRWMLWLYRTLSVYVPCHGYVGNLDISETSEVESIDEELADDASGMKEDGNGPEVLVDG